MGQPLEQQDIDQSGAAPCAYFPLAYSRAYPCWQLLFRPLDPSLLHVFFLFIACSGLNPGSAMATGWRGQFQTQTSQCSLPDFIGSSFPGADKPVRRKEFSLCLRLNCQNEERYLPMQGGTETDS